MGYSDAPDGEGCFEKIWATSKLAGMAGFLVGAHDVVMITKPQGYVPTILTFSRTFLPITAAGATFAAVTCTACNLRKKDDKWNYFIGGGVGGSIFGVATKSFKVGFPCSVFFACLAVLYKDSRDNGWSFFPEIRHKYGAFDHMSHDFTLRKDI
ncbi:hypothetical protein SK128_015718 [Halocaridina rubra]|uniref:NADH dehydrogenase [ubiquinone] 1 alpha subcomplex subunit 11 n=1 Tax=Halocaridina rubra TaxID=373956 RepID=A0AAN8XVM3_HALRR